MTSKSLWMDVDVMPAAGSLSGNVECDVAVIGSGIAGISTAYELCKLGMSVMVIDRGPIAGGMTSRTSAHLAPLCDDLVSEMMKIKGQEATKLFCDSQAAAIDRIEEIQKAERIDCDFRRLDGYLFQGRDMPADIIDEVTEQATNTHCYLNTSMTQSAKGSFRIPVLLRCARAPALAADKAATGESWISDAVCLRRMVW